MEVGLVELLQDQQVLHLLALVALLGMELKQEQILTVHNHVMHHVIELQDIQEHKHLVKLVLLDQYLIHQFQQVVEIVQEILMQIMEYAQHVQVDIHLTQDIQDV